MLIPVAARSKAWVCGRSLAGIAGSNPVEGMNVFCYVSCCCILRGPGRERILDVVPRRDRARNSG